MTAPRQYAERLGARLFEAGARPIWIPSIQITTLSEDTRKVQMANVLSDLSPFDHILFTSKNGIQAVLDALDTTSSDSAVNSAVKQLVECNAEIWALGVDSELLLEYGVDSVRTPTKASTQGLVADLKRLDLLVGRTVLCPVPALIPPLKEPSVVPEFLRALREAGAKEVVRMEAYETKLGCASEDCWAEKGMLEAGEISAIVFTSTAEADALVRLIGRQCISDAVNKGTLMAAHGPQTAAGVSKALDLPIDCINKNFSSFAGLVQSLEAFFSS